MNIAAGVAYLALVEAPGRPLLDEPVKMVPSDALTDAVRLKDFADRFVQEVRRLRVDHVAVAHPRPRPSGGWKYVDAFERVSLEVTLMLALKDAGIGYTSVKQHEAARDAGVSAPAEAAVELAPLRGSNKRPHWNERAVALMVALSAAKAGT